MLYHDHSYFVTFGKGATLNNTWSNQETKEDAISFNILKITLLCILEDLACSEPVFSNFP